MKRVGLTIAAAFGALAAGGAAAQTPPAPPSIWDVPAGAGVAVDRNTGRVSITMPSELEARAKADPTFAAWRATPYAGTGPIPATRVEDPSLPTHTLYYSRGHKGPLPIVLWANSGCRNTSVEFTRFLGELASRGYFVIAVGRNDVPFALFGPNDPKPAAGQPPLQIRGGEVVVAGLDWAARENVRRGSAYRGMFDLSRVAALGQSCGGGQVWAASRDSRIRTVVALNSNFPTATVGVGPQVPAPADGWTADKLTIPAAFFIGGPGDAAFTPSIASFAALPAGAVAIRANLPVAGHTGAYAGPDMAWVTAVTGWLDWQLKGDLQARALFAGADCGLCHDPRWWLEAKNLP